jgi:hypothetical protein
MTWLAACKTWHGRRRSGMSQGGHRGAASVSAVGLQRLRFARRTGWWGSLWCCLGVHRGAAAAALRKEELDGDDPCGSGSNASSLVTLNRQHPKRLSTTGGSTNGACSPSQEEAPAASHGGAGGCKGFGSEILRVSAVQDASNGRWSKVREWIGTAIDRKSEHRRWMRSCRVELIV